MVVSVANQALSNSLVVPDTKKETDVEESGERRQIVDKKCVWGLYCVYFIIGMINGFFFTYLNTPTICQYVFGPMGMGPDAHTTPAQCNVAGSVYQISWNFKIVFGIVLDIVPFFGSRRKGWMIFGWTGGLIMLAVTAVLSEHLVDTHQFELYMYLLTACCFFSTFADVAGDGMIIEISKHEADNEKGYILTSCQMMRFVTMMVSSIIGTLFMSGKSYQPPGPEQEGALVMPFELSFASIHWVLLVSCIPFYIGMWVWLKDPPTPEHHESGCDGFRTAGRRIWDSLKSYAMLMLLVQAVGIQAIANMINPANSEIASLAQPTNLQSGVGAFIGNLLFVAGVWVFRKFFLDKNWRFTLFMTTSMMAICNFAAIAIVYDTGGFCRNGWFYMLQLNIPNFIQGVGQVVGTLAVVEISPPGLEATIYELLTSAFNGAISLASVLQTVFGKVFDVEGINADSFHKHPELVPHYESKLANATLFCLAVNIIGTLVFVKFVPKNPSQCREWLGKKQWHTSKVAALNMIIFLAPYIYANYEIVSYVADPE